MINFAYFDEMDGKIASADFAGLLRLRRELLGEAQRTEHWLAPEIAKGHVAWREDACFIYGKEMEWIGQICRRLAECYANAENA